jgi:hypothetical protein
MTFVSHPIAACVKEGLAKGWWGFLWMIRIILPVSFGTFLLDFSGWLGRIDGLLEPLMGAIHLPAVAALPLLAGLLTGIYGAVAAMSVLPLSVAQMTLIAVFLLIAHSLVQEGLVQHRSGCPAWLATTVRLTAAVMTVWGLGWIFGLETVRKIAEPVPSAAGNAFGPALTAWTVEMVGLCLQMLLIITTLMILMAILKQYHVIDKLVRIITPCLYLLGLDRQVGMLWITASVFGITYGGAVIVAETNARQIPPCRLRALHLSIGINHAMVEDPALFLPLGIHPFWLWVPRLITAMVFTHLYRLWLWARHHRHAIAVDPLPAGGRNTIDGG